MDLKNLRKAIKVKRKLLDGTFKSKASQNACALILNLESYQAASHIALYHAFNGELDPMSIWHHALQHGKSCFFPTLDGNHLIFLPADEKTSWHQNKFGIFEPDVPLSCGVSSNHFDLLLIPLVAFDVFGHRIGMGAGYYDRFLQNHSNGLLVGLGYEFQKINKIIPNSWDIAMNLVVTESNIYWSTND